MPLFAVFPPELVKTNSWKCFNYYTNIQENTFIFEIFEVDKDTEKFCILGHKSLRAIKIL